jgi:hypothetical protein
MLEKKGKSNFNFNFEKSFVTSVSFKGGAAVCNIPRDSDATHTQQVA